MDELKGLLTEMLHELRRIRVSLTYRHPSKMDEVIAAQSKSETAESESPDFVVQEFLRGFH